MKKTTPTLSGQDFARLANNFYTAKNIGADYQRIVTDLELTNYITEHSKNLKKYKVALCFICVNPPYWQYVKQVVDSARQFFLPGHDVDFMLWSDVPKTGSPEAEQILAQFPTEQDLTQIPYSPTNIAREVIAKSITDINSLENLTVFPIEGVEWPYPTLMRFHVMSAEEEKLSEYDYIFYCDVDMLYVNVVGDEILGDGLTAAQHPMYALRKEYWPPYEPSKDSSAYIKRPGKVINDNGKPRFMPLYYAGGFQGGTAKEWIKAMKAMKEILNADLDRNYIPIWNDESVWNKYLADNEPEVVLTPSYIYPDSLIEEYYVHLWGVRYLPKLITLTKKFSTSAEGGEAVAKMVKELNR